MNPTFTATDGNEYEHDVWHPLPFWIPIRHTVCKSCGPHRSGFPGVPATDAGDRLVRRFKDGAIKPWGPFTTAREQLDELANPPTHWMVKSWSDYTI